MDAQPGAWFLKAMHPACAQNKTLISNTDIYIYIVFEINYPVCTFWLPGAWILKPVHPVCAWFFQLLNRFV